MRNQINYNKVVNIAEDGEITLLEYTFAYSDNFKGAVGHQFYPVTEDEVQERIGEYEDNDWEFEKYWADNYGDITRQMLDNIDSREALINHFFDTSYPELWDMMREVLGKDDSEIVLFDCVSGGRCFDKNFQGNVNPELSLIIREYEA